jgi:hypothetical protein
LQFGRQRPGTDIAAICLLFAGFCSLAYAIWVYLDNKFGVLLPIFFVVGLWASLRTEVRQIELRGETMVISTFFRHYPIPRAHVTNVVITREGTAIDVLNGRRYNITPPDVDADELARAVAGWRRGGEIEN